MTTFEGFLERSGQFGPYQWRHYTLAAGNWIPAAFLTWSSVFANMRPHWRLASLPADTPPETGPLPCDLPDSYVIVDAWQSVAGEWALVCGDAWKSTMLDEFFFVGFGLGAAGFGTFADRCGRRRATLLTTGVAAFFTMVSAASQSLLVYGILRGLTGVGVGGMGVCCYVWASEAVGPRWQGITGVAQAALFAMGEALLVLVSLAFPGWRSLTLFTGAFTALWLALLCFLDESPRWLLLQRRGAEAHAILVRMGCANGSSESAAAVMADALTAGSLPDAAAVAAAQAEHSARALAAAVGCSGASSGMGSLSDAAACHGNGAGSMRSNSAEGATTDLIGTGQMRSDDATLESAGAHPRVGRGASTGHSEDGLASLFASPLLHRTLPMLLAWCVASFVYYGLSLNSGNVRIGLTGASGARTAPRASRQAALALCAMMECPSRCPLPLPSPMTVTPLP